MNRERFRRITACYERLAIAVLGDFCLDRYLEIDPGRCETSIETGLPVHNVTRVRRAQPGGAGTVLGNLAALGVGKLHPIGFVGEDGEGFGLVRSIEAIPAASASGVFMTPLRRTFTYCKPLVVEPGKPPRELSRLDSKNWTETPPEVEDRLIAELSAITGRIDGLIVLEQVDAAETGVTTRRVLDAVEKIAAERPALRILADSRRGLRGFPPVCLKMNRSELGKLLEESPPASIENVRTAAIEIARRKGRDVFVTLAEDGMLAATPAGESVHASSLPLRGEIDIVGAGDAVTANLSAALSAGASIGEAIEMANAAASIVVHQLGTTGIATVDRLFDLLVPDSPGDCR